MHGYITPALLQQLFPDIPYDEDAIQLTATQELQPGIEVIGMVFAGYCYLVFFVDVLIASGGDAADVQNFADAWNNGFVPNNASRLVKIMRSEAKPDNMFEPEAWPLRNPSQIWQFLEVLATAMIQHAGDEQQVQQYFYLPENKGLAALYDRMSRSFVRGRFGVTFECVTRPDPDSGGFYGYQRQ